MELKEYIQIFKKHIQLFIGTIILVIILAIAFNILRPLSYKSSLNLSITRIGFQESMEYQYDEFYRLQADERFADTIARWIDSDRFQINVCEKVGQSDCFKKIKARRLSSQVVLVNYIAGDVEISRKIATQIIYLLNQETQKLNQEQNSPTWFKILGDDPVIQENKMDWWQLAFLASALGIFLGFWAVWFKHYFEK